MLLRTIEIPLSTLSYSTIEEMKKKKTLMLIILESQYLLMH